MVQQERRYWRVTWSDGTGDRRYEDRIGPFTSLEAAEWVAQEMRSVATTRTMLNLDALEIAD